MPVSLGPRTVAGNAALTPFIFVVYTLLPVSPGTITSTILHITKRSDMFTLLRQRRLRWVGHVYRQEGGRIPKDILYG